MSFSHLSREELLKLLEELMAYQERVAETNHSRLEDKNHLVRELELHQIELEVQNRELRETQSALEESRDRYADLYDFAPIGYLTLDAQLTVREINLTGAALLGKPRDALIGENFVSVARIQNAAALHEHLERTAAAHAPTVTEIWLGRDGTRAMELVSWSVTGARGRPNGYRCAMQDVTVRKVAEEQRRRALEAEQRLRQRFEALDRASLATAATLGSDAPGSLETLLETMASEALRVARAAHAAIELNDEVRLGLRRVVARHGLPRSDGLSCLELPIESGSRSLGQLVVGLAEDAEALTADDRKSLEMLLERVASALEIARLRQRDLRERTRLSQLEGVSRELAAARDLQGVRDAITRSLRALTPEIADFSMVYFSRDGAVASASAVHRDVERERTLNDYLSGVVESGTPLPVERPSGAPEPLPGSELMAADGVIAGELSEGCQLHTIPLRHGEQLLGVVCIGFYSNGGLPAALRLAWAEEICGRYTQALERARLIEDLQNSVRARDGILAIVSHDLRSPLNAISLCARELSPSDRSADRRKTRRQVELIQRCATRMDQLIEDLLTANSLELGRLVVAPRAEPLAAVVSEACQLFEPIAAAKSVTLAVEVRDDLTVQGDRKRLLQVLSNLVGNAIKFTPAGGHVAVHAESVGGQVKLSVADTGPGIPAHERPLVFDRYYTGSASSGGVGLGLYIAKRVVEAHGGSMWLESEPAAGCTFWFTLPTAS